MKWLWAVSGLVLILILSALMVGSTLHLVEYQPGADEGYYLRYSARIAKEGPGVFPRLFQEHLSGPAINKYFPSPMRVTTLLLSSTAVRFGGADYKTLSLLSLAAFLALLALQCAGLRSAFLQHRVNGTLSKGAHNHHQDIAAILRQIPKGAGIFAQH